MSRFIQLTFQTAVILSLVVVSFSYSNAQTPALWGDLEVGSYAVGFKFIYQQDYSRDWNVAEDSNGYPLEIGRGRPVRISVWYPAKRQSNAPKMLYRDYMPFSRPKWGVHGIERLAGKARCRQSSR